MNIYQMSADSFYDIDSPAFPYKWKKGVNMNIRTLAVFVLKGVKKV